MCLRFIVDILVGEASILEFTHNAHGGVPQSCLFFIYNPYEI